MLQPFSGQQHQTLIIEEFEPDVFRQLIEYIHTGCVTLQPRTLLGKKIYNIITVVYCNSFLDFYCASVCTLYTDLIRNRSTNYS